MYYHSIIIYMIMYLIIIRLYYMTYYIYIYIYTYIYIYIDYGGQGGHPFLFVLICISNLDYPSELLYKRK